MSARGCWRRPPAAPFSSARWRSSRPEGGLHGAARPRGVVGDAFDRHGNMALAAGEPGITRQGLSKLMARLKIDRTEPSRERSVPAVPGSSGCALHGRGSAATGCGDPLRRAGLRHRKLMFLEGRTETGGEKPMRALHPDLGANGSSGRRRLDAAAFVLKYPGACGGSAGAGRRGSRGPCVQPCAFGQQARWPGKIPGDFSLVRRLIDVLCCAGLWKRFKVVVFSDRLRAGGSGPMRVRRGVASLTCTPCCRLFLVPVTRSRVRSVGQQWPRAR